MRVSILLRAFAPQQRQPKGHAIETASKPPLAIHTSEELLAQDSGCLTCRISQLSARLNAQGTRVLKAEFGLSVVKWQILVLLHVAEPVNSAVLCRGLSMDADPFSRTHKTPVEEKWVKDVSQ